MNRFLDMKQAAEIFGFPSSAALAKSFRRRTLPAEALIKVGRRLRVDENALAAWLRAQTAHGVTESAKEQGGA